MISITIIHILCFFNFFFYFMSVCLHHICAQSIATYPQRTEEGTESPGTGVRSGCCQVVLGLEPRSSWRTTSVLNCWVLSPALHCYFNMKHLCMKGILNLCLLSFQQMLLVLEALASRQVRGFIQTPEQSFPFSCHHNFYAFWPCLTSIQITLSFKGG